MNKTIEQLLLNVQTFCLDRFRLDPNLSDENMFEDPVIKVMIQALYVGDLDTEIQEKYSIDDLKNDLIELS